MAFVQYLLAATTAIFGVLTIIGLIKPSLVEQKTRAIAFTKFFSITLLALVGYGVVTYLMV